MRIINQKTKKFAIGKQVIVKKRYESGAIVLFCGMIGSIVGRSIYNVPDMGLYNVKVIDLIFSHCVLSISEVIANEYVDEL